MADTYWPWAWDCSWIQEPTAGYKKKQKVITGLNKQCNIMDIQKRLLTFITRTNWVLLFVTSLAGFLIFKPSFSRGIIFGGLIVTINFHLLSRTLKKAFTPPHLSSHNVILVKYYVRFFISGLIIFVLISRHYVDPLGLFIGLSVVVASMIIATAFELKKLIFKEAV